ncbi:MAG: hypothetical protein M1820_001712 [Bogoriella megaspora]|nr:MAG: hypothetical protein M1820_001712 [Bogoriella megaspora]
MSCETLYRRSDHQIAERSDPSSTGKQKRKEKERRTGFSGTTPEESLKTTREKAGEIQTIVNVDPNMCKEEVTEVEDKMFLLLTRGGSDSRPHEDIADAILNVARDAEGNDGMVVVFDLFVIWWG